MKDNIFWAIILVVILFSFSQAPKQAITIPDSDISSLIDADVQFNGQNKYIAGSSLSEESVRVLRGTSDLGYKSLDSGTLSVTPGAEYLFLFFMNTTPSTTYYVDVQPYIVKAQESVDNVIGHGCMIDTSPKVIVRNQAGQTQTASANAQAIAAGETKNIEVDIRASADQCYGTPNAPKGNVICFAYDSTYFTNVKSNTAWVDVPYSVSSMDVGTVKCYEFDVLESTEKDTLTVELIANGEPTSSHNISIYVDDIAFDLNQNNLDEIWGYVDESLNQLGHVITSTAAGTIYVT